jgi:hypothetical protein
MLDAVTSVPTPVNEPVRSYAPGSAERTSLEARLKDLGSDRHDLTTTIDGVSRMAEGDRIDVVQPHRHSAVLAGDLVLVLVTFLVMRSVIYAFVPLERWAEAVRPHVTRAHAPFDQVLRLVLLATAVTLLATWPSQVGWQLATSTLGGQMRDARVLVAWACELPWLMGLTWLAVRHRLATASPARQRP